MHFNAERDPRTRTLRFQTSLGHLCAAAETHPTPSTQYHIALAYARPGASQDLQAAIENARLAVEGEPDEVRHWHLLGLLLTAIGDWRAAKGVLEVGAGVGEIDHIDQIEPAPEVPNGVYVHDFATTGQQPSQVNGDANGHAVNCDVTAESGVAGPITILEEATEQVPPSAYLLRPWGDRPPPSRSQSFEQALQLRMTQLALAEYVEGPEGAGDKWVEVFQWFSDRREVGLDDSKHSISVFVTYIDNFYKGADLLMEHGNLLEQDRLQTHYPLKSIRLRVMTRRPTQAFSRHTMLILIISRLQSQSLSPSRPHRQDSLTNSLAPRLRRSIRPRNRRPPLSRNALHLWTRRIEIYPVGRR